ncbi:GAF domain-containing protein [Amycolatopsis nalaikhensis]|uniref:GAF domain-containing protein n=1 Tax=Amycolatopsis nalaikhensis TaxID=715472 RepID=A0ABY8XU70_9PSEU|nr:GAF domain-containing protein [Amycolatopsis sp. 2-2]WIV59235.1 GAF domain-containing protein [Amycolatopsis sp. 2-2]
MDGQRRQRLWRAIAERAGTSERVGLAQAVCAAPVEVLDAVDAALFTLRAGDRVQEVLGASDQWAARLAELQYTVGEGPGVEAFTTGRPVAVPVMGAEQQRWPGFTEVAMATDVGAAFAVPLQVGVVRLGTLVFFRRRPGALSAALVLCSPRTPAGADVPRTRSPAPSPTALSIRWNSRPKPDQSRSGSVRDRARALTASASCAASASWPASWPCSARCRRDRGWDVVERRRGCRADRDIAVFRTSLRCVRGWAPSLTNNLVHRNR